MKKEGVLSHRHVMRQSRRIASSVWSAALIPAIVLTVWQVLGDQGYISYLLFPTPLRIWQTFVQLVETGQFTVNLRISVVRALCGFLLGGGLGLLVGVIVGLFRFAERTLDPTVQMIRMVPHLAVTSLFVLWFGIGETSKVLLIAKGTFFPVYINTFLGLRNVDNKLFEVARVLGYSKLKQVWLLMLPGSLPNIFLGMRLSVGVAWLSLVVAELMGASSGIGYLMMDARAMSRTPVVFVGIVTFAVIGVLSDAAIRWLERRALRWKDSFKG